MYNAFLDVISIANIINWVVCCSYNRKMLFFSAVFLSASLLLTRQFGSVGFVLANCVNMAVRIAHR